MNRKGFHPALLMGAAALAVVLAFVGIPFAGGVIPVIAGIVFVVTTLLVFAAAFVFDKPWRLVRAAVICIIVNLITTSLAEGVCDKPYLLALGWVMALLFSIAGIIMTVRSRKDYRIILSIIINSITAFVSVCVFIAEYVSYKGFVVIPAVSSGSS